MHLIPLITKNKVFIILVGTALVLVSVFAGSVVQKTERQSWFLNIQLHQTAPPFEVVHLYATKEEFDNQYELERYWGFDHIDYLQNIFIPYQILGFFAKRYGIDATPAEVEWRKHQELQRTGMTATAWKEMLRERELPDAAADELMRQKVIAEKMLESGSTIELTEEEVKDFYDRFLKNNSLWKSWETSREEARSAATRYKKLSIIGHGKGIGGYEQAVLAVQKIYLCRKSS